MRLDFWR
ncbi:hypothetical protein LINPERPRIM_LOCUS24530 [Linum perenne]